MNRLDSSLPSQRRSAAAALAAAGLFAALAACGAPGQYAGAPPERLDEGWQYRWGDSPRAEGRLAWLSEPLDAPGWGAVAPPAPPSGREGAQFLWMRARLPSDLEGATHLFLRYVDENVEAFVDGRLVYRFGDIDAGKVSEGSPFHVVPLGAGAEGKVLALRIYSRHNNLSLNGVPLLGTEGALVRHVLADGAPEFMLGVGLLVFAVAVFFLLGGGRPDASARYLAALSFTCGVYSLCSVYSPVKHLLFGRPALVWYLEFASLYLIPVWYFGFYGTIAEEGTRRLVRGYQIALAAFAVLSVAGGLIGLYPLPVTLLPFWGLLGGSLVLGTILAGRSALRGRREARIYLLGMGSVTVAAVHDVLVSSRVLVSETILIFWGFLVFIVCLAWYVVGTHARMLRERAGYLRQVEQNNATLADARRRVEEATRELEAQAAAVLQAASRNAAMTTQQSTTNRETSVTAETIARSSREAAQTAESVIAAASRSEELSRQGSRVVGEAVSAMEGLGREVREMAQRATGLAERTLQIGEVIGAVREMAEQSNLLALNAAMEAARAGEHGRGFAVVASEMRRLAAQSREGAEKVRKLLGEFHAGTRSVVEATEAGSRSASQAVVLSRQAGTAIADLSEVIRENTLAVRQIAEQAKSGSAAVDQIVTAIAQSTDALEDAVGETRKLEEAARRINELADRLASLARGRAAQAAA